MSVLHTTVGQPGTQSGPTPDRRPFWRRLLVVMAPLPWLALAASNAVTPDELGGSTEKTFSSFAAHPVAGEAAIWLSFVFAVTVVPSAIAMMMATRRVAPRMTTLIGGFVVLACMFGMTNPNLNLMALVTADSNLDTSTVVTLADDMFAHPVSIVGIMPFFLTITIGRIVLGIMLWRIRIAPRWMAGFMMLATPVEFLLVAGVGNLGPVLAYVMTAVGFASASVALLRMTEDEFDLPPLRGKDAGR